MYANPKQRLAAIVKDMRGDLVRYTSAHPTNHAVHAKKASLIQQLEQVLDSLTIYTQPNIWAKAQYLVDESSRVYGELDEFTLHFAPYHPTDQVTLRHIKRKQPHKTPRISHLLRS